SRETRVHHLSVSKRLLYQGHQRPDRDAPLHFRVASALFRSASNYPCSRDEPYICQWASCSAGCSVGGTPLLAATGVPLSSSPTAAGSNTACWKLPPIRTCSCHRLL